MSSKVMALLLLLFACRGSNTSGSNSATPLKFLLMVASPDSSAVVPAVDQTLEKINGDTSVLPGHHLEYILSENQCTRTGALDSFFNLSADRLVKAVVGCGCSAATEEVAKISYYLNISVISYASTSVVLSDKSVYRSFFRTVPSDELLVSAVVTIMNHYRWRQLSMFTEQQPQYLHLSDWLGDTLMLNNINNSQEEHIHGCHLSNFTILAKKVLQKFHALPHIFVTIGSHRTETYLLCAAYHNGRYYPNYAWILLGHHETDWWREHYMETNCSDTDMMKVLNRSLILIPYPDSHENNEYPAEQNQEDLDMSAYAPSAEQILKGDLYNVSAYASDAVRALAEALHNCFQYKPYTSTNCDGTELDWNFTFTGQTGVVKFNLHDGNRDANDVVVQQYQFEGNNLWTHTIGLIQSNNLNLTSSILWPDGIPPDGTPQFLITNLVGVVTIVHFILAGTIMLGVIIALGFNIIFRNRKIIKLTSPKLNYYLLFGITIMAISTVAPVSGDNLVVVSTICTISSFLSGIGYDIVAGVTLIKTWRVYYLFKNPSPNKKIPKDWQLLLAITFVALVEATFAAALLIAAAFNNDVVLMQNTEQEPTFNDKGVEEIYFHHMCGNSVYFLVFFGLSVAYKILLNAAGLVFAILIRNVKIDVLNDSQETVAMIVVSGVLQLAAVPVLIIISRSVNTLTLAWSIIIFFIAMSHLTLIFIPKVVALYNDPRGERVFRKVKSQVMDTVNESSAVHRLSDISDNEMTALKQKIVLLERKLSLHDAVYRKSSSS